MQCIHKHKPAVRLVICPWHICRIRRVFILNRISLDRRRKMIITPGKFIPGIIRLAVSILILHHRNHPGFCPLHGGIAKYRKVNPVWIVWMVFYGLLERKDYISTKCPQAQCTIDPADNRLGRVGETQRGSINELSGCRFVFKYLIYVGMLQCRIIPVDLSQWPARSSNDKAVPGPDLA